MAFLVGTDPVIDNARALVNVGETVNNLGNTTTSKTINLNNGTFVTATLTGNCTFTFSNPVSGASSFSLILKNDIIQIHIRLIDGIQKKIHLNIEFIHGLHQL